MQDKVRECVSMLENIRHLKVTAKYSFINVNVIDKKLLTLAISILEGMSKDPEKLAIFMHNTYEELSKKVGWKTQECCQVPWETLPTPNQQVMIGLARAILKELCGIQEIDTERLRG